MDQKRRFRLRRAVPACVWAVALLPALAVLAVPDDAAAQVAPNACHGTTEIAKRLLDRYGEEPVAMGIQSNGNLLQVYSSEEKGTWTVVTSTPTGMSCIVAAGTQWFNVPPKPMGSAS